MSTAVMKHQYYSYILYHNFSNFLFNSFSGNLKEFDIAPVYKKKEKYKKKRREGRKRKIIG